MNAATGSIVAYIDDDAWPDPHWLRYLAASFMRSDHAGIGGPNLAPSDDGPVAACVANAPGGPVHVLLSDEAAEHIPGCNMAFRKDRLMAVGGFDPQFRVAGDDVDLCWRLQERGWTLGFSPAVMVWHRRRNSIGRYLKQQRGYARAEALLAAKWPAKYNGAGHVTWHGRVYGTGGPERLFRRPRIYHGTWGAAPFQSVYERAPGTLGSMLLMPEWYGILAGLAGLSTLGFVWAPLMWATPLFLAALSATLFRAARGGARASFRLTGRSPTRHLALQALTAWLHILQPIARMVGRMQHGLGPWRSAGLWQRPPLPFRFALWSEHWQAPEARLAAVEGALKEAGAVVYRGGDFDAWDLGVCGGLFGWARVRAMVEEHGAGRQLFRLEAWPRVPAPVVIVVALLGILATAASDDGAWVAGLALAAGAAAVALRAYSDTATAMGRLRQAVDRAYAAAAEESAGTPPFRKGLSCHAPGNLRHRGCIAPSHPAEG